MDYIEKHDCPMCGTEGAITTFVLQCGYARHMGHGKRFRKMRISEAKVLPVNDHPYIIDLQGNWRVAKVNGVPKTWKSEKNRYRVKVPLKYGMYEFFYDEVHLKYDGEMNYLLVEVKDD